MYFCLTMNTPKKEINFIINPISGTKGKQQILSHIDALLDKQQFEYQIQKTEYAGHASILAKEATERGTDIVVAIGGDGTINEVARSLVHTNTALGIIPCGSGNGLARHLQIPMESKKAISLLNQCYIEKLDYGTINGHPFFCTCGIGFDAFISFKFANAGRRGLLTYLENTLREGLRYKPETYIIEDETGTFKHEAFLIACANASQYGNNAYIAPQASMSDGLMDITIMEPFNAIESPQIAIQLFSKTLEKNSHIKMFKAKKVKITRQKEGVVHCDGEPIMTGHTIEIETIEKGLNIVTNPQTELRNENLLQFFTNLFEDIHEEIITQNRRIASINKSILKKLTKKH